MEPRLKWNKLTLAAKINLFHFKRGSVQPKILFQNFGTTRAVFTKFLCMLPMSVALSSGMLTIGRVAYRREAGDGTRECTARAKCDLRLPCFTC